MHDETQRTVYLKDYTPPPFLIPRIDLDIDLVAEDEARVAATLVVNRHGKATDSGNALTLDLDEIEVQGAGSLNPPRRAADRDRGFDQCGLVVCEEVTGTPASRFEDVFVHRDATGAGPCTRCVHLATPKVPPSTLRPLPVSGHRRRSNRDSS